MITFSDENMKLVYVQGLSAWFFQDEAKTWFRLIEPEHKNDEWISEILRKARPNEVRQIAEVQEAKLELGKLPSWNPKDSKQRLWLGKIFPIGQVEAQLRAIHKE